MILMMMMQRLWYRRNAEKGSNTLSQIDSDAQLWRKCKLELLFQYTRVKPCLFLSVCFTTFSLPTKFHEPYISSARHKAYLDVHLSQCDYSITHACHTVSHSWEWCLSVFWCGKARFRPGAATVVPKEIPAMRTSAGWLQHPSSTKWTPEWVKIKSFAKTLLTSLSSASKGWVISSRRLSSRWGIWEVSRFRKAEPFTVWGQQLLY